MEIKSWMTVICQLRAIAVIRAPTFELGCQMASAVAQGGIQLIEITWNSDRAPELIPYLRESLPDCVIGTGTLLTTHHLREAIAVGAQFLFSPHVDVGMIQAAVEHNIPMIAGALSPTEIIQAWQAGCSSVKVFPVQALGGVEYIQSLQGPLGHIPLIPTGGVTLANVPDFLQAGAVGVGLSGCLFPQAAVQQGQWQTIVEQAQRLVALTQAGNSQSADPEDNGLYGNN
ncbi:bifunctional 4-hydroxy-2-oxoglutarate aldolase/2-dehydro-3-deoxy-phosphogluconate aldolase [Pantanalinema sp. GBBB05]|uniref:bifunctional 4-hydroxy-2-oxoglutarate aldolase/2-dehydro-3-deoxy-phosphogluconate aldolase n=1 Tax=Pantanalinema sp. GBBB05 TaxID=2604139 RepID=UPI001D41F096|nr:bifunctional 4-hydroxy-2-oxoglutarate aldolase/2-dehydro-3-deoxy-phosphogluconate aldolase [Pantanalinema sp. GBBB05]